MELIWLSTPLVQEYAEHKQLKTSGLGSPVLLDAEKWLEKNSFIAETASAVQDRDLLARRGSARGAASSVSPLPDQTSPEGLALGQPPPITEQLRDRVACYCRLCSR
jgi:hypothetical protein